MTPKAIRTVLNALLAALLVGHASQVMANDTSRFVREGAVRALESAADQAEELIDYGLRYLGVRYRRGGTSPETGFDCSGLVQRVFRAAAGLELPRTTGDMARLGERVDRNELRPGDLVFFNTMRRTFSHVGIYLGDGRFLHAPSSGGVVRVDEMSGRYWTTRFNGARRLIPEDRG